MGLSIRTRLVGGFLLVVVLIGAIGLIALRGLREVADAYDGAVADYAGRAVVGLELQVAVLDQVRAEKNYLLRGEPSYLAEARVIGRRVRAARAKLWAQPLEREEKALLQQVEDEIQDLDMAFQRSVQERQALGTTAADRLLRGRAANIVEQLDSFVTRAEARAQEASAAAAEQARQTRTLTLALLLGLGVVAVGLALALSLSVTLPLGRLQSQIKQVAEGEAVPSAPAIAGRDEVAQIAKAFHDLVQTAALMKELETRSKRLAALSTRVARAQEKERERIARELHDGLGQALTAIKLDLTAARRSLAVDLGQTSDYLEKARLLTEESLDELRRMVFDLRPPALDHLGLVAALESYCRAFEQRFKVAVTVSGDGFASRLPFEVETALYRICQEALANIAEHAAATRCTLTIEQTRDEVTLTVQDDGRGFDPATIAGPNGAVRGIGILSMERRVEELGGQFRIESRPGEGTAVLVAVPLSSHRTA